MTGYIEREAFLDAIERMKSYHQDADDIVEMLQNFPAADVRSVVKAVWEEKEKDGVWWYACSVCGEHIPKGRWGQEWHSNFCPNCGADMREES